jgi:hypothetical protein
VDLVEDPDQGAADDRRKDVYEDRVDECWEDRGQDRAQTQVMSIGGAILSKFNSLSKREVNKILNKKRVRNSVQSISLLFSALSGLTLSPQDHSSRSCLFSNCFAHLMSRESSTAFPSHSIFFFFTSSQPRFAHGKFLSFNATFLKSNAG